MHDFGFQLSLLEDDGATEDRGKHVLGGCFMLGRHAHFLPTFASQLLNIPSGLYNKGWREVWPSGVAMRSCTVRRAGCYGSFSSRSGRTMVRDQEESGDLTVSQNLMF